MQKIYFKLNKHGTCVTDAINISLLEYGDLCPCVLLESFRLQLPTCIHLGHIVSACILLYVRLRQLNILRTKRDPGCYVLWRISDLIIRYYSFIFCILCL